WRRRVTAMRGRPCRSSRQHLAAAERRLRPLAGVCDGDRPYSDLMNQSSRSQRGARLLDPARRVHLLKEEEGAFDHRAIFQPLSAAPKASVGQQRLRQLGPRLDFAENLEAAAERGIGLRPISHGLVDLPKNTVSATDLKTLTILLREFERAPGGIQSQAEVTRHQVELGKGDLHNSYRPGAATAHGHFVERLIENPSRVVPFSQLQI